MKNRIQINKPWASNRSPERPRPVSVSELSLITTEELIPGCKLPLVIKPALEGINLPAWAANNRELTEKLLFKHGAILFRDFSINGVTDFSRFCAAASREVMEYKERSSPRHEVSSRVYTSTDYPADQSIFPHNEHSYSKTFPLKLFFYCQTAPSSGGQTPIADCRKVLQRISDSSKNRFVEKSWMYVRNFGHGFGLPWQTVYQTEDRAVVENYCRANDVEFEWKDNDRLRTRQVRPTIRKHPFSGEAVWFNHATFFHLTTLEPVMREALLTAFGEDDLPNNTFYGDGQQIETAVMDELRDAYLQEVVMFDWREGDILMLDNMLTAHARAPYSGPRKILVAMADPYTPATGNQD